MGYIKHDAVVVVTDQRGADAVMAYKNTLPDNYARHIVGPTEVVNGYFCVAVLPDGSKEGWQHSDDMDTVRDTVGRIAVAESEFGADVVAVRFGGDDDAVTCAVSGGSADEDQ